ncbi:MAG TPA: alpha/beta hydrolase-fold protein, partial [Rugosimonospora sp.]|nr:alpha/beta hydrolase-fold protein [Rugosimonospora sp.]
AAQINGYWGMYPTLHALNQALHPGAAVPLPRPAPRGRTVTAPAGRTLLDAWHPPAGMPTTGVVSRVDIPGWTSGFRARPAYVYLPPAYLVAPRPLLPVVVLLAGQPGEPGNWITALRLADLMDAYARAHHGLAPVAVVPDDLGATTANPLCVDSPRGNVETYLARDVPAWIRANLQVDTDRRHWFIGGYSHGGTCSLQLAVRAPAVYGGFVDISGQREPTLGSRAKTLQGAFGGSAAAFARINPLDILRRTRYPDTVGLLAAGTADTVYLPQQRQVYAACQAARMGVRWLGVPGGHTMTMWREAFRQALPWLGVQGGIADRE